MKPLFAGLVITPILAVSGFSQIPILPPAPGAFPQIRQFLSLTDAQLTAIVRNNGDYNRFAQQQQELIRNAQIEIAVQTAKDPLDPMALGTLYAGIESACRELRDKAAASRQQNLSILTDAQKVKLNMLSDAMKMAPLISEAQSGNLLGSANATPFGFFAFSSSVIAGVIGLPASPGCGAGALTGGIFTGLLPAPVIP